MSHELHNGEYRDTELVAPNDLLVKEMEETNTWARLGAQLYFGWFTLLLTVNGFALGWLFTPDLAMPKFAGWVFLGFAGLDVLGTIATYRIRQHLKDSDRRIREVIEKLTQHRVIEGTVPRSPVPLGAIKTALGFTGLALMLLSLFWPIMAVNFPHFALR